MVNTLCNEIDSTENIFIDTQCSNNMSVDCLVQQCTDNSCRDGAPPLASAVGQEIYLEGESLSHKKVTNEDVQSAKNSSRTIYGGSLAFAATTEGQRLVRAQQTVTILSSAVNACPGLLMT